MTNVVPNDTVLFLILVVFRQVNALLVCTYFNPDEFWQGPEVAHNWVFGYGYLTWEWRTGLRGALHPGLFAALFWLLRFLRLDFALVVSHAPRALQAVFQAAADLYVFKLAARVEDRETAVFTLCCQVLSWFTFFCGVRPFSNSLEMTLTVAAVYHWRLDPSRRLPLVLAALACIARPTSAILWLPLWLLDFLLATPTGPMKLRLLATTVAVGALALALSVCLDSLVYGRPTFVILNFLRFNVVHNLSRFYGVHPWHWYFTQGFPTVMGGLLPLFAVGIVRAQSAFGALLVGWLVFVLSFIAHKEFRFLFPVLPLAIVYCGVGLRVVWRSKQWRAIVALIFAVEVGAMVYFCQLHQRAPISLMAHLRSTPTPPRSLAFLTPCHATPFLSALHIDLPMRMLDCAPPLHAGDSGRTEVDLFYDAPAAFLHQRYATDPLPAAFVLYDVLLPAVRPFLESHGCNLTESFFHSLTPLDSREGKYMLLYECGQAFSSSR